MAELFEVKQLKKIIDWMRQWSLLILVVSAGAGYLTVSDNWQVYTEPLHEIQGLLYAKLSTESKTDDLPKTEDAHKPESNYKAEGDFPEGTQGAAVPPQSEGADAAENTVTGSDESSTGGQGPLEERQDGIQEETQEEIREQTQEEIVTRRKPEEVEYLSVEDDYFEDAVFIGDSRTVGLYEYAGLEDISTFYASTGLTIYKLFDAPIVEVKGQKQKKTVEEALSEQAFSKIYLMIGINEMGTGTVDSFMETYAQAVEHLRELQPDAVIYLQGIMKVTTERSEQGDYITNEGIEERNERIAKLADYVNIYYLDVNPLICDETGGMEASYTYDGVHLKAQYISIWKDFLKSHAVDKLLLD